MIGPKSETENNEHNNGCSKKSSKKSSNKKEKTKERRRHSGCEACNSDRETKKSKKRTKEKKKKVSIFKFSHSIFHSSEIRGLCSTKCSSEMLQNLLYFMYTKTYLVFFIFHFMQLYFSLIHAWCWCMST